MHRRDLQMFIIYKSVISSDEDGDNLVSYISKNIEIQGNIQPFFEKETIELFGLNINKAFVIYTTNSYIKENSRLKLGNDFYDVKIIQEWRSYKRLLTEKVVI